MFLLDRDFIYFFEGGVSDRPQTEGWNRILRSMHVQVSITWPDMEKKCISGIVQGIAQNGQLGHIRAVVWGPLL